MFGSENYVNYGRQTDRPTDRSTERRGKGHYSLIVLGCVLRAELFLKEGISKDVEVSDSIYLKTVFQPLLLKQNISLVNLNIRGVIILQ